MTWEHKTPPGRRGLVRESKEHSRGLLCPPVSPLTERLRGWAESRLPTPCPPTAWTGAEGTPGTSLIRSSPPRQHANKEEYIRPGNQGAAGRGNNVAKHSREPSQRVLHLDLKHKYKYKYKYKCKYKYGVPIVAQPVKNGVGRRCGSDSTSSPGISICRRCGP